MNAPFTPRRIEAASNIVDVWMGGRQEWRERLHESDFLESADWEMALQLADAALATPPEAHDRIDLLERALDCAHTILSNMAEEHTTGWRGIFARWPIHHEPLRNDAQRSLSQIRAALGYNDTPTPSAAEVAS